jgi:AcrR family transcriptional regulator
LRDRVLQVAVAMLANDGVSGFTTRKVAQKADTSPPAVYELFGDKAGLVREMFFEGFRALRRSFDRLAETRDARADLVRVVEALRKFVRENPALSEVMFSRPFRRLRPRPFRPCRRSRSQNVSSSRRVRRCIDAGLLAGDETDIAHVLVSMTQGLAATEMAGWLGTSKASVNRRWSVAIEALLERPAPGRTTGAPLSALKDRVKLRRIGRYAHANAAPDPVAGIPQPTVSSACCRRGLARCRGGLQKGCC